MAKFGKRHAQRLGIIDDTSKKFRKYVDDPKFKARMAKIDSIPIISKYDVPYVCGYSQNAHRIYFDRHLKTRWNGVDITKFLKIHEWAEKTFIDLFNMKYQQAHHFALYFERKAVAKAGLNWNAYQDHIEPYIKNLEHEKLTVVPPDLDLEPYADEHDTKLLQQLKNKEREEKNIKL